MCWVLKSETPGIDFSFSLSLKQFCIGCDLLLSSGKDPLKNTVFYLNLNSSFHTVNCTLYRKYRKYKKYRKYIKYRKYRKYRKY